MMGMITALMAMLYAYVEARFVLVLAVPVWVKVIFSFFLELGIFNLIVVLQWGYLLPEWVWRLFSIAQVLLIYALLATIVLDVLRLFHVHTTSVAIGLAVVCLGAAAYAGWHAASLPIVKEVLIESDHLPADWQPLKIVQLTDLHIGQGFNQKWLKQVVDKTNALHPDVIVITGDSIDNTVDQLLAQMEPLGQLKARWVFIWSLEIMNIIMGRTRGKKYLKRWGFPFYIKSMFYCVLAHKRLLWAAAHGALGIIRNGRMHVFGKFLTAFNPVCRGFCWPIIRPFSRLPPNKMFYCSYPVIRTAA